MAFSGRDRSKSSRMAEEFIPLTSDQDGSNLESSASLGSLVTRTSASTSPVAEEGNAFTMTMRSVNTEPVLSRDLSSSSQDSNVTTLSLVHDEVNKIFDSDWRFELDALTTDPNSRAPVSNVLGRECSKLALSEFYQMDEAEFARHRRVSYPHIHQPLRSLSSKSLSKSGKAHKARKKARKKKKKQKIWSFPSQSAIKSPTIVEEDEEYYMEYSDDSASSSGSDVDVDEDYDVDSRDQPVLEANGGLTLSRSVIPVMTVMPPSPDTSPSSETTPLLVVSPSLEKLPSEDLQSQEKVLSPYKQMVQEESPQGFDEFNSEAVNSGVDFYIGTVSPSQLMEQLVKPVHASSQSLDQEYSSTNLLAVSNEEEAYLSDPGTPLVHEEEDVTHRCTSSEPGSIQILCASPEEEAPPSNRPAYLAVENPDDRGSPSPGGYMTPTRRQSLRGKVTFVLGGDSAYPSSNNLQTELSDPPRDGNDPGGEGNRSDKENVWKKKDMDAVKMREDSEGDMQESSPNLLRVPSIDGSHSTRSSKRRHHHHHEHFRTEDLIMRRQKGSEVKLDKTFRNSPTETEEASVLYKADLDEMASHRFEDQRGIRRHKIARKKGSLHSVVHIGKTHHERKPKVTKKFDHSPHEVFVELDELHFGGDEMMEWREKARWIKFEEDVEEGAERWGKPHVASLSFHSLLELRRGLEKGTVLLDLEATDLTSIVHNVVENMVIRDLVDEDVKAKLLRTLLLKHKHVNGRSAFLRRTPSYSNLASLDSSGKRHQQRDKGLLNSISQSSFGSNIGLNKTPSQTSVTDKKHKGAAKLEMVKVDVDNNMVFLYRIDETDKQTDGLHIGLSPVEQKKHVQDIMKRIPKGAEASTVLVGQVNFLTKPAMAFVRLSEGRILDNLTEVPLPVRFLFILLGPEKGGMDYHEVGRSLSTLMSNQQFHEVAYRAESREDLLRAINNFLDDSIVLPPGDWDHRTLLPITHMARKRALLRKQKKQQFEEEEALLEKAEKDDIPADPLQRTGCLFGGVINDVRRRYPHYPSDITDAANIQSIKTLFFIFFTCLSPCIAFGGLLSEKTESFMGVSETMLATSVFGMIFSLLSGQPLLIIGATGPVLVFEESLFKFCSSNEFEFLPVRFWIGLWVCAITSIAVALEGSFLVRYITRFTEEIFAILISLIFIYEVVKKLMQIFSDHPLMEGYCFDECNNSKSFSNSNWSAHTEGNNSDWSGENITHGSLFLIAHSSSTAHEPEEVRNQPNTALLSLILVFGTFLIAYFLRVFRNSKFLGQSVRRALGDFGVLISLLSMVLLSIIMNKTYVQKLDITDSLTPTSRKRGWFINPMGIKQTTPLWLTFAAALPGFLIFILLFMETQITEMILNKKERKLKKGSGYHLDQLILGLLTLLGGLFGLPWMCAATVRTVAHVSALSEYSQTHAPGEKPQLLGVKEQRITNFAVHLLIGLSIGMGPVLRAIPVPALFGIFLYLGVSTLSGVQMCERIKLLLMPVKYHPSVGYVRKVRTMQMHKFTLIQLTCLLFLLVIKSTAASLAFPFMLILLVPFRLKVMPRFFDSADLTQLDKEEEEFELDDEDDPDFYQQAHMPI